MAQWINLIEAVRTSSKLVVPHFLNLSLNCPLLQLPDSNIIEVVDVGTHCDPIFLRTSRLS